MGFEGLEDTMNIFIGIMAVTGFIFWVLVFAWLVGWAAEKMNIS